jgi:hypothetical protein
VTLNAKIWNLCQTTQIHCILRLWDQYPPHTTHWYHTNGKEFHFNIFYCIRQHDKMLKHFPDIMVYCHNMEAPNLILNYVLRHMRVISFCCSKYLKDHLVSAKTWKHDSRMLPTYFAEDKNILYYTLNFLGNKRYD